MKNLTLIILAVALSGCNLEEEKQPVNYYYSYDSVVPESPLPAQELQSETQQEASHNIQQKTPQETQDAITLTISQPTQGQVDCTGECELPITGYNLNGSTMFNIESDKILKGITINQPAKVCYKMASGWYVIQEFKNGKAVYKEAIESCYHGTYEVDVSQWEWDTVVEVVADIRGDYFTIQ